MFTLTQLQEVKSHYHFVLCKTRRKKLVSSQLGMIPKYVPHELKNDQKLLQNFEL